MDYFILKEKELIKKSQRGDTKAFDEIINRNSSYVLGWITSKTKDPIEVEELFQVTMIKCWKNINKFRGDSAFKTWACAVARNLFIDDWRRRQRRKEESLEAINNDGWEKIPEGEEELDFLKELKNEELGVFLEIVMRELSMEQSNVLRYFALEELSYGEISKMEKCAIGTVMSRLFYARKRAQALIKSRKNNKIYCGHD
tara:strand:+ start:50 stop:649 length:600 start_codon:yes stop_codon:yes gene_type:complete